MKDLIKLTAEKCNVGQKDTKEIVDTFIEVLKDRIMGMTGEGEVVRIMGLGTFRVRELAERNGFNPKENKQIVIPAHLKLAFKPSSEIKNVLKEALTKDKKTVRGAVHFVLATGIGETAVQSGIDDGLVLQAIRSALQ